MREELFKNGAELCIATMFVAAGTSEALLTAGTATTGLAALLLRLRKRHGPQCAGVQAQIKARLEAKYGALARVPEFAGELRRASDLMGGVVRECLLPLDALARTAFDEAGFAAAAERALMAALPFDEHERTENRLAFRIVAEAVRAGLDAGKASPEFRAALADEVVLEMAREIGLLRMLAEETRDEGRTRGRMQGESFAEARAFFEEFRKQPERTIDTETRDALEVVARLFGHDDPEHLTVPALQGFLTKKAAELDGASAEVEALRGTTPRIDNVLAEVEAALERLDLATAEDLLAGVRETSAEALRKPVEDNARIMEAQARVALLRGRADDAFAILAAAAESFAALDAGEVFHRYRDYLQRLYWHGLRYGGSGIARAVELGRRNVARLAESRGAVDWATAQNDLGNALQAQGSRTAGAEGAALLGEAVAAYGAALRVYTEGEHPVDWAMTQNNLGNALRAQGSRTAGAEGAALLGEAVTAYGAALRVYTEGEHSVDWATTMRNLGRAHEALAENPACPDAKAALEAAVACFEAALRVYDPEHMPHDHRTATEALGRVRAKLGGL